MDEKYIVQFITLLGSSIVSVIMAYRVLTNQVDINYALIALFFAMLICFILGRILRRILFNIKKANIIRENERLMEELRAKEKAEKKAVEAVQEAVDSENEENESKENSTGTEE